MTGSVLEHDWYGAPLPENVSLGPRSWLYSSYAFLHCRSELEPCVRLGSDSGVYDGTMFDLGPTGSVEIGRFCSVVAAVIRADGPVVVHDYALVSWNVFIGDLPEDVLVPPAADARRRPTVLRPLVVGEGAWIGAGALILRGASIGRNAIVGAGAVVREDVPPGAVVAGNPARVVRTT